MGFARKKLLIALACGVTSAVLLTAYTVDVQAQAASGRAQALAAYGGEQVEVLVPSRDIAAGEVLDASNASFRTWVADLLPAGAIINADDAYGKTTAVPLMKNEPVAAVKLGAGPRQLSVPEGLCAVSVPTDDIQAVGGALSPGMAVDVYAVGAGSVSLVAQDVLVLETSNGFGARGLAGGSGSASLSGGTSSRAALKWATLAVDAEMVQELLAVSRDRSLSLVLPGDGATPRPEGGATPQKATDSGEGGGAGSVIAQDQAGAGSVGTAGQGGHR